MTGMTHVPSVCLNRQRPICQRSCRCQRCAIARDATAVVAPYWTQLGYAGDTSDSADPGHGQDAEMARAS